MFAVLLHPDSQARSEGEKKISDMHDALAWLELSSSSSVALCYDVAVDMSKDLLWNQESVVREAFQDWKQSGRRWRPEVLGKFGCSEGPFCVHSIINAKYV